jgi:threonine/homoserine/homoserine lactone efflux protein
MAFVPDLNVMLAYAAAAVILVITPGPDMTLFLGQTLTGGRARGIAAYLGASAGLVVHTMLAAFGLSALLAHSVAAFGVLKIFGVAYLLWLAIHALRYGSALTLAPRGGRAAADRASVPDGRRHQPAQSEDHHVLFDVPAAVRLRERP